MRLGRSLSAARPKLGGLCPGGERGVVELAEPPLPLLSASKNPVEGFTASIGLV